MLKIYLARHGQDQDNANGILNGRRDESLTEVGVTQAKESSKKIKEHGLHFDYIYSSPLKRTYETAEIIANGIGAKEPEVLHDLIEREFGVMTGKKVSCIKELCSPDILQTDVVCYFLNPQGAETFPELIERAKKVLHYITTKHADGNILLVTHGDIGKMIYAAYYHLDWKHVLKMFTFGNTELLELSEDSDPEKTHIFTIEQHNS